MLTFPPDSSFLIQIVLFIVLWIGLKRLLFDPVLHVLETRDARTSGLNREAAAMKASAEQSAAEYERRMREVRHEISASAEAERAAAHTEERQRIAEARQQASNQVMQLRDRLADEAEAARTALGAEAHELSVRMLESVVGKKIA
jgi:F-type H+-transporting ATPase subunit b